MQLKDQVVSLELAKQLKELGFEQESYFYWQCSREIGSVGQYTWHLEIRSGEFKPEKYSAYTVAELGKMLPDHFHTQKSGVDYFIDCKDTQHPAYQHYEFAEHEADCRAKMLIHLKTNKLI